MNRRGEISDFGKTIMLFVGIIVIVSAFIPTIFNTQNLLTDKQSVVNESIAIIGISDGNSVNDTRNYTLANVPEGWKLTDCPITNFVLYNNTGNALTVTTDYLFDATYGNFTMVNNTDTINIIASATGNTTLADYDYCDDGYNKDAGARGIAGIIGLFAVIALLAYAVYHIKFKD